MKKLVTFLESDSQVEVIDGKQYFKMQAIDVNREQLNDFFYVYTIALTEQNVIEKTEVDIRKAEKIGFYDKNCHHFYLSAVDSISVGELPIKWSKVEDLSQKIKSEIYACLEKQKVIYTNSRKPDRAIFANSLVQQSDKYLRKAFYSIVNNWFEKRESISSTYCIQYLTSGKKFIDEYVELAFVDETCQKWCGEDDNGLAIDMEKRRLLSTKLYPKLTKKLNFIKAFLNFKSDDFLVVYYRECGKLKSFRACNLDKNYNSSVVKNIFEDGVVELLKVDPTGKDFEVTGKEFLDIESIEKITNGEEVYLFDRTDQVNEEVKDRERKKSVVIGICHTIFVKMFQRN